MTVTVADLASLLSSDVQYVGQAKDTVFYNVDSVIGKIIPMKGVQGGSAIEVPVIVTGNTSVQLYTENQALPARGQQTVVSSTFDYKHFRAVIGETGHARRAKIGGGLRNQLDAEIEVRGALNAIKDLITTTFITNQAIYSIAGIIDDATTNFGDLSRATYTSLVSYVLGASSAAISSAIMNNAYERSKDAPYGARVQLWLMSPTQASKYAELISQKVSFASASGNDMIGTNYTAGGAPVVSLPDLTTSIVLGLTDVDGSWGAIMHEDGNMGGMAGSGFHVKYMGASDDSDTIQISTSLAIYCDQPQRQVRIEALSTT